MRFGYKNKGSTKNILLNLYPGNDNFASQLAFVIKTKTKEPKVKVDNIKLNSNSYPNGNLIFVLYFVTLSSVMNIFNLMVSNIFTIKHLFLSSQIYFKKRFCFDLDSRFNSQLTLATYQKVWGTKMVCAKLFIIIKKNCFTKFVLYKIQRKRLKHGEDLLVYVQKWTAQINCPLF